MSRKMVRAVDKEIWPIARQFCDKLCNACDSVHLFFFDDDEEPICEARLSKAQIEELYMQYCVGAKQ